MNEKEFVNDLDMVARMIASHDEALQLIVSELRELRRLLDQNLIRIKLLERREGRKQGER